MPTARPLVGTWWDRGVGRRCDHRARPWPGGSDPWQRSGPDGATAA